MDLLTLLIILLVVVIAFGGGGYYQGWYAEYPYAPPILGLLIAVILIFVLLRAFGRL